MFATRSVTGEFKIFSGVTLTVSQQALYGGRESDAPMLDPVWVAYLQHAPRDVAAPAAETVCCRCGQRRPVTPLSRVVSAKFTGFDRLTIGDGLCVPCAWSFSSPVRRLTLAITETAAVVLDSAALYDCLLHPAQRAAVVVPISGRKHVLPYAQWGTIRVDDINLQWRPTDVHRLQITADLRRRGAPAPALAEHSPPHRWLRTQPTDTWEATHRQWRELEPWRPTPHVDLAIKATHHLKGPRG